MKVANFLVSINMSDVVRNAHWPIVENDLRYVGMSFPCLLPVVPLKISRTVLE